jgi:hypothetical protein
MRSFVIGLVLLFAVFTFVGAMSQPKDTAKASVEIPPAN